MGLMTVDDKSGGKFLWTDPALMVHTQRRPQREVEEQEPPLASHPYKEIEELWIFAKAPVCARVKLHLQQLTPLTSVTQKRTSL